MPGIIESKRGKIMITAKLEFTCVLCGNKNKFYIMPLEEKVNSGDFIHSPNKYKIVCKNCKKTYVLTLTIKAV